MSRLKNRLPYILDDYEIEDLLDQFDTSRYTGLRNYLIVSAMVYSGLTTQDIVELKWDDVGIYEGYIFVRDYDNPKNNRKAGVTFEMIEHLRDLKYMQYVETGKNGYVFTTRTGNKVYDHYITETVKRYANRAGLPECVNTYTLRHTFATNLYKKTQSLEVIKNVMGYSRKDVGTKYKYLANDDIVNSF